MSKRMDKALREGLVKALTYATYDNDVITTRLGGAILERWDELVEKEAVFAAAQRDEEKPEGTR